VALAFQFRAVRGYWPGVLVFALLGAALVGTVAREQPEDYRSHLRLLVFFGPISAPRDPSASVVAARLHVAPRLVELHARRYAQMVDDPTVLRGAIAKLRLPYSPGELAGRVSALTPLNTTYVEVNVTDADPRRAVRIGDAVASQLATIVDRDRISGALGPLAPRLFMDRRPVVTAGPVGRPWQPYAVAGLVGGFLLGTGLAALRLQLAGRGEGLGRWMLRHVAAGWRSRPHRRPGVHTRPRPPSGPPPSSGPPTPPARTPSHSDM
jgi:succinoglycan biosynthesis transport protein ExoP